MFKKSPLKSSKLVKKKRRIFLLKTSGVAISIVLVFLLVVWISRLSFFRLDTVTVQGNFAVDAEEIEENVLSHISGHYFFLFPKNNRFLYPKKEIETTLLSLFKRLESVSIDVDGLHTISIAVVERKPSFVWCKGTPTQSGDCYFLDTKGYVFSQAPVFSGNPYFSFYGVLKDESPIGQQYMEYDLFMSLTKMILTLEDADIKTQSLHIRGDNVHELYLSQGGKILFKSDQKIPLLESNIKTVFTRSKLFAGQASSTIEYLDMRFGNKVYYKFNGDNQVLTEE